MSDMTAHETPSVPAGRRWSEELAAWAIDPEILAAAPESPYALPPQLFAAGVAAPSPLLELAGAALPDGGTVLDVGAGGGAASLPLFPPAGHLHAVDSQPSMLVALREAAGARGVDLTTYEGVWPDIADRVPVCDVVVCSHVAYNVPDLAAFATALTTHARARVVMELYADHPWVPLGPLWEHFHHQPRPTGPTADLAIEVLQEAGIDPDVRRWSRPAIDITGDHLDHYVAFTRRRLCLPASRDAEVAEQVSRMPRPPRESVVLSWAPGA
jgi:SAM-dependent methyltransferase